jgi:hypothetical protein
MSIFTVFLFTLNSTQVIAGNQSCITTECSANHTTKESFQELAAFFVFVIGRVKNPVFDNYLKFQVIDLKIIGLFEVDMGVVNFKCYHLNESWIGFHMYYYGINLERILLFHPETAFLCGIVTAGYFDTSSS